MLTLVSTKVLSLSALGAGSFILGVLPLWLRGGVSGSAAGPDCPRHAAGAGPVLTALLSFGAGALLSTALVHMLAEASELLPRAAPVALLVGFLVLYLVDELVQRLVGHSPAAARAHRHLPHAACPVDEPCPPASKSPSLRRREDYGSMDECVGVERLPAATGTEAACLLSVPAVHDQGRDQHGQVQSRGGSRGGSRAGSKRASAASLEALGAHSPSVTSSGGASCWGLLLALIIHSIIEGLAVGLEDTPEQVIFLLGAVSSHKLVVSFCLGAELVGGGVGLVPHLVAVLVFAGGSAAGVGVGMALYNLPGSADAADPMLLPVLQAAAAGTLLYVTLAEVLPRERARSQHNFPRRFLQFVSFTAGAVLITVLVLTMPDEHHAPGEQPLGPV